LQNDPRCFPWQIVSLQAPQRKVALSVGAGSNDGRFAFATQSGDAGAEKIAARFALASSAGVADGAALAREPISRRKANVSKVDLSFIQVSFEERFTAIAAELLEDLLVAAAALRARRVHELTAGAREGAEDDRAELRARLRPERLDGLGRRGQGGEARQNDEPERYQTDHGFHRTSFGCEELPSLKEVPETAFFEPGAFRAGEEHPCLWSLEWSGSGRRSAE
jgi:hypothetical protein